MPPSRASGVESCTVSFSLPIPACNRQNAQPPSGASDGISMPHFGQSLGALIIAGGSLTRSLSFLLRKMLAEVTPGLQQLNREAYPRESASAAPHKRALDALQFVKFRDRLRKS